MYNASPTVGAQSVQSRCMWPGIPAIMSTNTFSYYPFHVAHVLTTQMPYMPQYRRITSTGLPYDVRIAVLPATLIIHIPIFSLFYLKQSSLLCTTVSQDDHQRHMQSSSLNVNMCEQILRGCGPWNSQAYSCPKYPRQYHEVYSRSHPPPPPPPHTHTSSHPTQQGVLRFYIDPECEDSIST